MTVLNTRPSGRRPVRIARMNSASDQLPRPAGVMFDADTVSGGDCGILPPDSPGPWQTGQPAVSARYWPYSGVTAAAGVGGLGVVWSILSAGCSGSWPVANRTRPSGRSSLLGNTLSTAGSERT